MIPERDHHSPAEGGYHDYAKGTAITAGFSEEVNGVAPSEAAKAAQHFSS